MLRNTLFRTAGWIISAVFLLIAAVLIMPAALISNSPINLNQLSCQVADSSGNKTFRIYTPSNWKAQEMAALFCDSVLVGSDYSRLELSWKPRERFTSDDLLAQHFDLLFSRPRVLNGLVPDSQSLYEQALVLPAYTIYLYGHIPIRRLASATLYKRTIGLLDDKRSQSGFLIPEVELKKRGVKLSAENTRWFHHRNDLVRAFIDRDVDFIPAIGIEPELVSWSSEQRIALKTIPSAGSWYLSHSLSDALKCSISQSLITKLQESPLMGELLQQTKMSTDACS